MAVIVNMLPMDQVQNTGVQSVTNKVTNKPGKTEVGFAKALTSETDKVEVDTDSKLKGNDTNQLMAAMAAMAGVVVPVVEQTGNNTATLGETAGVTQTQLTGEASVAPQTQLMSIVPVVSQTQLTNAVPVVPQSELMSVVPGGPQTQLADTVPVVPQTQTQSTNVTSILGQEQLATVPVPQTPLTNSAVLVPAQTQSTSATSEESKLGAVLSQKTAVTTPMDNTQVGEFAQLQAKAQLRQNQTLLGQVDVVEVSKDNIELVTNSSAMANMTPSLTTVGNTNLLGKNTNNQPDNKKVVLHELNVEGMENASTLGMVTAGEVKPVVASQETVAVVDSLSSDSQGNLDISLANQPTKTSDLFASMLTQEGMKIDNQTGVEGKSTVAQPVPDSYKITSQIVDQARLVAGNKNTEMIIQLKPEHLGELTFKVSVENGIVSASFHSNNPEVRSVIESSLYQLKQEMSNQGLKIDNVGVYAGLGEFFSNNQQAGTNQQPVVKNQSKKNEEDFLEVFEATDVANRVSDGTGVDYRA